MHALRYSNYSPRNWIITREEASKGYSGFMNHSFEERCSVGQGGWELAKTFYLFYEKNSLGGWSRVRPFKNIPDNLQGEISSSRIRDTGDQGKWWASSNQSPPVDSCESIKFDERMLAEMASFGKDTKSGENEAKKSPPIVVEASHIQDSMKLMNRMGMIENRFDVLIAELKPAIKQKLSTIEYCYLPCSRSTYRVENMDNYNPYRNSGYDEDYDEDEGDIEDDEGDYSDDSNNTDESRETNEQDSTEFYRQRLEAGYRNWNINFLNHERPFELELGDTSANQYPLLARRENRANWIELHDRSNLQVGTETEPISQQEPVAEPRQVVVQPLFTSGPRETTQGAPSLSETPWPEERSSEAEQNWSIINIRRNTEGISEIWNTRISESGEGVEGSEQGGEVELGTQVRSERAGEEEVCVDGNAETRESGNVEGPPTRDSAAEVRGERDSRPSEYRRIATSIFRLRELQREPLSNLLMPVWMRDRLPPGFQARTRYSPSVFTPHERSALGFPFIKLDSATDVVAISPIPPCVPTRSQQVRSQFSWVHDTSLSALGSGDLNDFRPKWVELVSNFRKRPHYASSSLQDPLAEDVDLKTEIHTLVEHRSYPSQRYLPLFRSKCIPSRQMLFPVEGRLQSKYMVVRLDDPPTLKTQLHALSREFRRPSNLSRASSLGLLNLTTKRVVNTWQNSWSIEYLNSNSSKLGYLESFTLVRRCFYSDASGIYSVMLANVTLGTNLPSHVMADEDEDEFDECSSKNYTLLEITDLRVRDYSKIILSSVRTSLLTEEDVKTIIPMTYLETKSTVGGSCSRCLLAADNLALSLSLHLDSFYKLCVLMSQESPSSEQRQLRACWISAKEPEMAIFEQIPQRFRFGQELALVKTFAEIKGDPRSSVSLMDRGNPQGPHLHIIPPNGLEIKPRMASFELKNLKEPQTLKSMTLHWTEVFARLEKQSRASFSKSESITDATKEARKSLNDTSSPQPFLLERKSSPSFEVKIEPLSVIEEEKEADSAPQPRVMNKPTESLFKTATSVELNLRQGYLLLDCRGESDLFCTESEVATTQRGVEGLGDPKKILGPSHEGEVRAMKGRGKVSARAPRKPERETKETESEGLQCSSQRKYALVTFNSQRVQSGGHSRIGGMSIYDEQRYQRVAKIQVKIEPS